MLRDDTFSVNIAQSLDQKTDSKVIQPNKLASIKNRRFNKFGTLNKRPGQAALTTTIVNDPTSALAMGTGLSPSGLFAHENQLLEQNKGAFYSRSNTRSAWAFKNYYLPVEITSEPVVANYNSQSAFDSGVFGNLIITAYNTKSTSNDTGVSYSVIEAATGNFLVQDAVLSSNVNAKSPAVVIFPTAIIITYKEGVNLKSAKINTTTGAVTSTTTVRSDMTTNSASYWAVTTDGTLGDVAAFLYQTSTGYSLGLMDDDGAFLVAPGIQTFGTAPNMFTGGIFIDSSFGANKVFVTYVEGTTTALKFAAYTFSSSAWSSSVAAVTVATPTMITATSGGPYFSVRYYNQAMIKHPTTANTIVLLVDNASYQQEANTYDIRIYSAEISTAGSITDALAVLREGVCLAAKPFVNSTIGSILIPAMYDSLLQASYTLIDYSMLTVSGLPTIHAKWHYGLAGGQPGTNNGFGSLTPTLGSIWAYPGETGSYAFVQTTRSAISNQNTNGVISYQNGGKLFKVKLALDRSTQSAYANGVTHFSGGQLSAFDGATFSEHGFSFSPETPTAATGGTLLTVTTTQEGGASVKERTRVQNILPGIAFKGNAASAYVQFHTTTTSYFAWIRVDGTGSVPAGTGTAIVVDVLSGDSYQDVVFKIAAAIDASPAAIDIRSVGGSAFEFENSVNGSVTNSSGSGTTDGSITAGNYQYQITWKWTDADAKVYRSAPSVPVEIASTGERNYLAINTPALTNRDITKVVVEVWSTGPDGTVFRKLSERPLEAGAWSSSARIGFFDDVGAVTDEEPLYTTGGTLENYSVGACRLVSSFKGRVVVVSDDDPYAALISKPVLPNTPIEFSDAISIRVPSTTGTINSIFGLDDKFILATSTELHYSAGEPANALGTGSTLFDPVSIAADTGVRDPNSVVVYADGALFKSNKGIYRLDRGLQLSYIGMEVENYNDNIVSRAVLDKTNNEIRFYHSDTTDLIVYNYIDNKWAIWQNHGAQDACIYSGSAHRVDSTGKVHQSVEGVFTDTDGASAYYTSEIELPWLKLKGLQDFQRVRLFSLLGDYVSPHTIVATVYYDYDMSNPSTHTLPTSTFMTGTSLGDAVYQAEFQTAIQKCQAIKIKFVETPASGSGESAQWTDVSFEVALKKGLNKVKAAKRA